MQQEKLLKLVQGVLGVVLAIITIGAAVMIFSPTSTPESEAAFKLWEAQQTRQEGHGGDQAGDEMP